MSDTTSLPKLAVSIPEACAMIGVGETLLGELMSDGSLRFSRVGRKGSKRARVLIKVTDLDKLLEKGRAKS